MILRAPSVQMLVLGPSDFPIVFELLIGSGPAEASEGPDQCFTRASGGHVSWHANIETAVS